MPAMKSMHHAPSDPVLLAIGGHDPGGGAGLQADIEAAAAIGLHCCTAVSCITVQTSCRLSQIIPQPAEQVRDQCLAVFEDYQVAAIKIGLIGHSHLVQTISALLEGHPDIPVVFDPVLAAGSGERIADAALLNQLRRHLLKRCRLITPNLPEALLLADTPHRNQTGAHTGAQADAQTREQDRRQARDQARDQAAHRLLAMGPGAVLITGTHDESEQVINTFYPAREPHSQAEWPRLPESFHGSGCTLASAIAARLALGMDLAAAVDEAQQYTMATLMQARALARCQRIPRRLLTAETSNARPNALRSLVAPTPAKPDNGR